MGRGTAGIVSVTIQCVIHTGPVGLVVGHVALKHAGLLVGDN